MSFFLFLKQKRSAIYTHIIYSILNDYDKMKDSRIKSSYNIQTLTNANCYIKRTKIIKPKEYAFAFCKPTFIHDVHKSLIVVNISHQETILKGLSLF